MTDFSLTDLIALKYPAKQWMHSVTTCSKNKQTFSLQKTAKSISYHSELKQRAFADNIFPGPNSPTLFTVNDLN